MSDEKDVGLMVRLPPDLHEELKRYAAGNGKRPRSSLNATVIFFIARGVERRAPERAEGGGTGADVPSAPSRSLMSNAI